jgi:hypothetical protein
MTRVFGHAGRPPPSASPKPAHVITPCKGAAGASSGGSLRALLRVGMGSHPHPELHLYAPHMMGVILAHDSRGALPCLPARYQSRSIPKSGSPIHLPMSRPLPPPRSCIGKRIKGEVVEPDQGLLGPEFEDVGYALGESTPLLSRAPPRVAPPALARLAARGLPAVQARARAHICMRAAAHPVLLASPSPELHQPLPTNIIIFFPLVRAPFTPSCIPQSVRTHTRAVCSSYPRSDLVIQTHAEEDFLSKDLTHLR